MAILAVPKTSTNQQVASGVNARSQWTLPNKVSVFFPVRKLNALVILVVRLVSGVSVAPERKDESKKE